MGSARAIYVECLVRGSLDEVWRLTQTPKLHQRWDARFSEITYCARDDETRPQRFLYVTRIGAGLRIAGEGETVASSSPGGARASALRFWSDDPKSLIRAGSGYWKYEPVESGVRFLTRYDYQVRFGALGRFVDRFAFRPLMGWATAWSFDRLRLWIEHGVAPELSMQRTLTHAAARLTLAFIWIYQGVVPKLLYPEFSGELETLRRLGWFPGAENLALTAVGLGEVGVGLVTLAAWRWRAALVLQIVALVVLGASAAASDPLLFARQFNPATLNAAMVALAACALWNSAQLPSAANCRRSPSEERE